MKENTGSCHTMLPFVAKLDKRDTDVYELISDLQGGLEALIPLLRDQMPKGGIIMKTLMECEKRSKKIIRLMS